MSKIVYDTVLNCSDDTVLQKHLKSLFIDLKSPIRPYFTAAAQFALESNLIQVERLLNFGASPKEAVLGFVFAGLHEQVEKYRIKYKISPTIIAEWYALADNHDQVEKYRTQYDTHPTRIAYAYALMGNIKKAEDYRIKYNCNVNYMVAAYATAGNFKQILMYCNTLNASLNYVVLGLAQGGFHRQVKYNIEQNHVDPSYAAAGYAMAGSYEHVSQCQELYHDIDESKIAYAYARVGDFIHVEPFLERPGIEMDSIAQGFVFSEQDQHVTKLFKEYGASADKIAYAYALIGNHEQAEHYRTHHGASTKSLFKGYLTAQNHNKCQQYPLESLNYLLTDYLDTRASVKDAKNNTKEYFYSDFFSFFQKSYTEKRAAVNALQKALENEPVDLSPHLNVLRNGSLGSKLRTFIKAGRANQLVDTEVSTVREFVAALQNKLPKCSL